MNEPTPKRLIIALPAHERGRSADELKRLDVLNRRIAKPLPKGDKKAETERDKWVAERDALERRPTLVAEGKWVLQAVAESEALARGRGEEVGDDRGMRRIMDRDPLLSLLRAGALTPKQFEAGQAVRELYDLRMGDAASAPFDGMPAGTHDHNRFVANRFTRAKTTLPVGQLETALLNGHFRVKDGTLRVVQCWPELKAAGMEVHVSLKALRWVCCDGHTLTSLGRGRAYDRNRRALCWALDVADEILDGRAN